MNQGLKISLFCEIIKKNKRFKDPIMFVGPEEKINIRDDDFFLTRLSFGWKTFVKKFAQISEYVDLQDRF